MGSHANAWASILRESCHELTSRCGRCSEAPVLHEPAKQVVDSHGMRHVELRSGLGIVGRQLLLPFILSAAQSRPLRGATEPNGRPVVRACPSVRLTRSGLSAHRLAACKSLLMPIATVSAVCTFVAKRKRPRACLQSIEATNRTCLGLIADRRVPKRRPRSATRIASGQVRRISREYRADFRAGSPSRRNET